MRGLRAAGSQVTARTETGPPVRGLDRGGLGEGAATIGEDLSTAGVARVRTQAELARAGALPHWLGDTDFHRSHQSALLRKDPEHYWPLFQDVPDDLPYVWPEA